MGYNKILIPLDGSQAAELVLQHLPKIAEPGAHIHLVSVLVDEPVSEFPRLWAEDGQKRRHDRETYLLGVATDLKRQGFKVTTVTCVGPAIEHITEAITDDFDLVLMATHRRSALGRFMVGSVSYGILNRTDCSILIV